MSELAQLLTAIGGLVGAIGSVVVLIINSTRTSRRERPRAARNLARELAKAAADGEITAEELRAIVEEDEDE